MFYAYDRPDGLAACDLPRIACTVYSWILERFGIGIIL